MNEISLDQIDNNNYDVVIAGAGAGGLLTALSLSAEGKRVLILERANQLGGVWFGYYDDGSQQCCWTCLANLQSLWCYDLV